jgi:transcription factor Ssl1
VSIISLSAAIFILQKVCSETQGEFSVAKDAVHFEELLQRNLLPKISLTAAEERDVLLIKMGFPKKNITQKPVMCSCHKLLKCVVFECPKCGSYQCDVPSFCKVCNLMLASSAHLTRTSHHNNPVDIFDVAQNVYFSQAAQTPTNGNHDVLMENGEEHSKLELVTCGGCEKIMEKSFDASKFISI